MVPFIEVRGLEHAYALEELAAGTSASTRRQVLALRGVTLAVERGEFVSVVGPNGSGKSTLARHLNGLLQPAAGEVWVDGLNAANPGHLPAIRQRVGMVFQNPDHQIVAATVEEDLAFGPENLGLPPAEIRLRVDEALALVGMGDYRRQPPHMLSGGQKQRVAIAGALAARPVCLVLDEPTSMLDPPGRQQVLDVIRRLNAHDGLTIVLITQSMEEAALAGRIVVMNAGKIVLDGPPGAVFDTPGPDGLAPLVRSLGLDLPFAVDVARRLRAAGLPLPPGLLTAGELARALC
jgi:energy-coupling factor transport system ATP-binding protein